MTRVDLVNYSESSITIIRTLIIDDTVYRESYILEEDKIPLKIFGHFQNSPIFLKYKLKEGFIPDQTGT